MVILSQVHPGFTRMLNFDNSRNGRSEELEAEVYDIWRYRKQQIIESESDQL